MAMGMIQVPKLIIFGTSDLLSIRVLALGLGLGIIAAGSAYLGRIILRECQSMFFPRPSPPCF